MVAAIEKMLSVDHDRLDALLAKAVAPSGEIDREAYAAFRSGLAKHIGMEEKILFAAARRSAPSVELRSVLERLRADHGRLTLLLVPSPTPELIGRLRAILEPHNAIEEGPGGAYEACEKLLGPAVDEVLGQLERMPEVPMRPHYDGPLLDPSLRRGRTTSH